MREVKLRRSRIDGWIRLDLVLASGRRALMTFPREMTEDELKEIVMAMAFERCPKREERRVN